jgi:hypothetical protein
LDHVESLLHQVHDVEGLFKKQKGRFKKIDHRP